MTIPRTVLAASLAVAMAALGGCQGGWSGFERAKPETSQEPADDTGMEFLVVSADDSGTGTLREAIQLANRSTGGDVIRFDPGGGVFGPPRSIVLASDLPEITDDLVIDAFLAGNLWKAAGIILDGAGQYRILSVAPGVKAEVRNLTLANGSARKGGAVLNRGSLLVSGVTFEQNEARSGGGAVYNDKGDLHVINSTLIRNGARSKGGGIFNNRGSMTATNCTFTENRARKGGAIYDTGQLLLRNSILANSDSREDCFSSGQPDPRSTHNIIELNGDCPGVLHEADPALDRFEYYNGMTRTVSLGMRSLAANAGSNEAALDENGEPLRWDQRGNGDPRFVAGYTDIGAFETQVYPKLVVDSVEDKGHRGCGGGDGDCPFSAAIRLADSSHRAETVSFDPRVFQGITELVIEHPLPVPSNEILIDASALKSLTVRVKDGRPVFEGPLPDSIVIVGLTLDGPDPGQ